MTTVLSSSRCRNPLLPRLDLESTPEWLQLTSSINDLSSLTLTRPHLHLAKITRTEEFSRRSYPTSSHHPSSPTQQSPPPSSPSSRNYYFCTPSPPFISEISPQKEAFPSKAEGIQRTSVESTGEDERSDVLFRPGSAEFRGSRERLHEIFEHNRRLRKRFFEDDGLEKVKGKASGFGSTETLGSQSNGSSGDGKARGLHSPDYGDDGIDPSGKDKDNRGFSRDFVHCEECSSVEKKTTADTLKSPQLVSSFSNSRLDLNAETAVDGPLVDTEGDAADKKSGWRDPGNGSSIPFVYGPIPYKSPRRYVEGEVTIHYRSPVRTETKEILSEEELARRSAENMRRVYQEERRRKYLQELHDIDSRRHTDNFTPSQKSPIPLNRYDDFLDDSSYRSRSQEQTPEPRLVARALYNFVGQTSRELSFRRGDIILIRRQIDKNWYEGEHNAMIGLFPLNYVEILPYDGTRGTPKKSYEGQARAKFNFIAQTNLELSLAKGELVVLTRRVDENWFEGRVGNKKGIFPVTYVEVIVEPGQHRPETPVSGKPVASPAAHSMLSNGTASGKLSMGPHHYIPSIPVKTSTAEPQYISLPRIGVTERNKLHVAPVNETLHIDTHSDTLPYRALYNYRPQNEDELELKEGDTVYVMEKCDDGWFVGSSQRTGYFGTFPGNYVERL